MSLSPALALYGLLRVPVEPRRDQRGDRAGRPEDPEQVDGGVGVAFRRGHLRLQPRWRPA